MINSLLLVGCGKMGSALLKGWLETKICKTIIILEPNALPDDLKSVPGVIHIRDITALPPTISAPSVAVLAIKPQIMRGMCETLAKTLTAQTLILSIAAGTTLKNYECCFGKAQPIIRSMPNTPASIGKGAIVAIGNAHTAPTHKKMAETLLEKSGELHWIDDESLMDAVTALSGSGPAYLFYLIELMEKAGTEIGLPPELSKSLARQTVIGAAALAESSSAPAATLRQNVTSPGGTTEAALNILMNGEAQDIFTKALQAAKTRGQELSS